MREILFRGKGTHGHKTGKWVYGNYAKDFWGKDRGGFSILPFGGGCYEVDPETIGQFTGLTDKNGTKIFEGDIVKVQDDVFGSPFCNGITGKVVYDEAAFFIEPKDPMETQWLFNECAVYEVIGNIHDNPEMLGGEGK